MIRGEDLIFMMVALNHAAVAAVQAGTPAVKPAYGKLRYVPADPTVFSPHRILLLTAMIFVYILKVALHGK